MRRGSWPERRPRVSQGQAREKWWLLATLAYAFLLSLLEVRYEVLRLCMLRDSSQRTGRHSRSAKMPLTGRRCALSRVWHDLPANFASLAAPPKQIHVTLAA